MTERRHDRFVTLSFEEVPAVMEAVRKDDELACRICELLQIKDSLRLAYREIEQPDTRQLRWHSGW